MSKIRGELASLAEFGLSSHCGKESASRTETLGGPERLGQKTFGECGGHGCRMISATLIITSFFPFPSGLPQPFSLTGDFGIPTMLSWSGQLATITCCFYLTLNNGGKHATRDKSINHYGMAAERADAPGGPGIVMHGDHHRLTG
jgi:hypothetical protein